MIIATYTKSKKVSIQGLPLSKNYKGQTISRLKKLIKNLDWQGDADNSNEKESRGLIKQIPEHLQPIWPLLSRKLLGHPRKKDGGNYELYQARRNKMLLSPAGNAVGAALIKVSNTYQIMDVQTLLEKFSSEIQKSLKADNPPASWEHLLSKFYSLRQSIRKLFNYSVEAKSRISIPLDQFSVSLQVQVQTYMERAKNGCAHERDIKKVALTKYKLDLKLHKASTIHHYVGMLELGLLVHHDERDG